jgi:pimeloyl-ACP methyl ester carboxylesterase
VIVPYLRGYCTTRFLSSETFRNGQQSVVAIDIIALMDALKIQKPILAVFDWGARTANIIAALWPERCKALVSVSGHLIGSQESNKIPLPPKAELVWWYTAAMPALTKALALELAPVRVNLIAPGFVDTPLSASLLGDQLDARREQLHTTLPIGRVVGPADIAALAVHLMTNTAVTGATYHIDGGQQLVEG